ncbi:MAG: hypothetical protein M9949_06250 [Candidatus Kapabacteria bacterium]|nr:hypothetical protein [Candidatus Kapabacteria bacterium]
MPAIPLLYGEPTFLRLVPGVFSAGQAIEIASLGSKVDFLNAVKVLPAFAGTSSGDESPKYHTTEGANKNQYSVLDGSKNYNILDGSVISEDAGADNQNKFEASVMASPAQRSTVITAYENGTPVIASREIGRDSETGLIAGYEFILGKVTDFKDNPQAGPHTIDFTIIGIATFTIKETVPGTPDIDHTDYNSIATGAGNTIQPTNETARTITEIDGTDWTRLLAGKVVTKLV